MYISFKFATKKKLITRVTRSILVNVERTEHY